LLLAHAVVLDPDGTLAVVDLGTLREAIERLSVGNTECVTSAVIDGRPYAITGHPDGTVRVWELGPLPPDGHPVTGHRQLVVAVVTAQLDGRPHVVSGAYGGDVRTWDLATGAPGTALETGGLAAEIAHSMISLDGREHVVATTGRPVGDLFVDDSIGPHTGISAADLGFRHQGASGPRPALHMEGLQCGHRFGRADRRRLRSRRRRTEHDGCLRIEHLMRSRRPPPR
jgi:WD40 repeat protein